MIFVSTSLASASQTSTEQHRLSPAISKNNYFNAEAKVLGLTSSELTRELQSSTIKELSINRSFSKNEFRAQVKAEIETELMIVGYSQNQINKWSNHSGRKHH